MRIGCAQGGGSGGAGEVGEGWTQHQCLKVWRREDERCRLRRVGGSFSGRLAHTCASSILGQM